MSLPDMGEALLTGQHGLGDGQVQFLEVEVALEVIFQNLQHVLQEHASDFKAKAFRADLLVNIIIRALHHMMHCTDSHVVGEI